MTSANSLHRSVLFVPGAHRQRIEKAATIPADVLVFDLEDAVQAAEKDQARQTVLDALNSIDFGQRRCVVRVNDVNSSWFEEDVAAVSGLENCSIMLPKYDTVEALERLKNTWKSSVKSTFGIIETALGVLSVAELAKQMDASDAICFGHVDFAADMGLADNNANKGAVYHARCQVALAARAYGISALDNISLEVKDEQVIKQETQAGLDLGYQGKLCIHPRQVDIANKVYTPTEAQVEKAKAILTEWAFVKSQGQGVFSFENKMVDLPVIRAQEKILARYEAILKRAV